MNDLFVWLGIVFCVSQSAMFSGLNLAFFSLSRLRLEIEAEESLSKGARKVLAMRKDSNFLLTTILWGNVGINVLLTLLTDSVLTGLASFAFSTVVITFFGEIIPQAYFSRNALKMAGALAPVLQFYQVVLYPVSKPCAVLLDKWLGKESIQFFTEQNIKSFIQKHIDGSGNEIGAVEGKGAINFFTLDDQKVMNEGAVLHPESIVRLNQIDGQVQFPIFTREQDDPFIRQLNKSGKKWVVFTDEEDNPALVMDTDGFIRSLVYSGVEEDIQNFCHEPFVITNEQANLGQALKRLKGAVEESSDDPIKTDVLLYWSEKDKRIITGADVLGRLLRGI